MTARAYLELRGWTLHDQPADPSIKEWWDSQEVTAATEEEAVTIQRARDAAEERAAWVRFASRIASAPAIGYSLEDSARIIFGGADALLAEYRKRFAVEIDPEVPDEEKP